MTGQVRLEDRRVYVALPAYGSGVAEPRGHSSQPAVSHIDLMILSTLPPKTEGDARAFDVDVLGSKGRESERTVLARVFDIPYTHERFLEDPDRRGQNSLPRNPGLSEICVDARPYAR